MAFETPELGHPIEYSPEDYKDHLGTLKNFSDSGELETASSKDYYPYARKTLHQAENAKSNLIISVIEDDPKVLINILEHLDRLFRSDLDPSIKDKNVYCVWATSSREHNKEFNNLTQDLNGEINSLAILDANLSRRISRDTWAKETGHQVLDFLFRKKEKGLISKVFAQFQSSAPYWAAHEAYKHEKRSSKVDKYIPFALRDKFHELESLHLKPGYRGVYRRIGIPDGDFDSFQKPNSFKAEQEEKLLEKLKKFYKLREEKSFSEHHNLGLMHRVEQGNQVFNTMMSIFKKNDDYEGIGVSFDLAKNAYEQVKKEFKPIIDWYLANIDKSMKALSSDRLIPITNKLSGNIETWTKSLVQAVTSKIDEEAS